MRDPSFPINGLDQLEKSSYSIEVFSTNVQTPGDADAILLALRNVMPDMKMNFDLDDCDKILRIAGHMVIPELVMRVLANLGYRCSVLP